MIHDIGLFVCDRDVKQVNKMEFYFPYLNSKLALFFRVIRDLGFFILASLLFGECSLQPHDAG